MKTARDVIEAIDEAVLMLEQSASGPCVDALLDAPVDRDTYREAIRRASELRGIKQLRDMLINRVELAEAGRPPKAKRGKAK